MELSTLWMPVGPDQQVWRYMSLQGLKDIVSYQRLRLTRLDIQTDPDEFSLNFDNVKRFITRTDPDNYLNQATGLTMVQQLPDRFRAEYLFEDARRRIYTSSWHLSHEESEEMWKQYGTSTESIAIVSRVEKITGLITKLPQLGIHVPQLAGRKVAYSLENEPIEESKGGPLTTKDWAQLAEWYKNAAFIKKSKFNYENEYRVATLVGETAPFFGETTPRYPNMNLGVYGTAKPITTPKEWKLPVSTWDQREKYIFSEVVPGVLIESIITGPNFDINLRSNLHELLANFELSIPILHSAVSL